ncbi:hypothetical protein PT974_03502 [Cladobotryum mycophilum]|uniref:Uncharacterized protein n=1 Tax=Cladobotryum mycophilum TaxID=491253 RepID=A0ABR0SSH2_9HYPO
MPPTLSFNIASLKSEDEKKYQTYKITEASWIKSSKPDWRREYIRFNVKNPGRGWLIGVEAERCAPSGVYMGKGGDGVVDLVTVHPRPGGKGVQIQDDVIDDPSDRLATLTFGGGNAKQLPTLYDVGLLLHAAGMIGGKYEPGLWDSPWFAYVIYRAMKERYQDLAKEDLLNARGMSLPPGWDRKHLASVGAADESKVLSHGEQD